MSSVASRLIERVCAAVGWKPKKFMKPDKIIVGLGNPGARYRDTRHNVGFMTIDDLVARFALGAPRSQFHAESWDLRYQDQNILLLKPSTFMNLSGTAVAEAVRFYKLDPSEALFVVCDDLDLPVAKLRLRESAGSGGQKGLKDIAAKLGTQNFPRVRIGIGRPSASNDVVDFVLTTFRSDERAEIDVAIKNAADSALLWATNGMQAAMNKYNVSDKAGKESGKKKRDE